MASRKEEAAGAAWEGADLDRPLSGEDPESDSLAEARRWIVVYRHLVKLEQELFDVLAKMIPAIGVLNAAAMPEAPPTMMRPWRM